MNVILNCPWFIVRICDIIVGMGDVLKAPCLVQCQRRIQASMEWAIRELWHLWSFGPNKRYWQVQSQAVILPCVWVLLLSIVVSSIALCFVLRSWCWISRMYWVSQIIAIWRETGGMQAINPILHTKSRNVNKQQSQMVTDFSSLFFHRPTSLRRRFS